LIQGVTGHYSSAFPVSRGG